MDIYNKLNFLYFYYFICCFPEIQASQSEELLSELPG